jgi:hypothetical protein
MIIRSPPLSSIGKWAMEEKAVVFIKLVRGQDAGITCGGQVVHFVPITI